ncbi:MAG: hypothetical protein LBT15_01690 [Synergistaceae bacterium]|jgi:hypothetical protein|nr:hypothetical protein [Synergistaceae bacterium]
MKYVNVLSVTPAAAFVEFYAQDGFGGEKKKLTRGEYKGVAAPKSVKVAKFTQIAFYENENGSGKSKVLSADAKDLKLDFKPALVEVSSYVECLKGGAVTATLTEGEYKPAEIKKYDAIRVPRGVYLAYMGNGKDENAVHMFENEEAKIDGRVDAYSKVAVFALAGSDLRVNFKQRQDLSDADLEAVAGGKFCAGDVEACGGKACGIAM